MGAGASTSSVDPRPSSRISGEQFLEAMRKNPALRDYVEPRPAPHGMRWLTDVVYGTAGAAGRDLILHMYAGEPGEARPAIVFIHGGGAHPFHLVSHANELAASGYATATIEYRGWAEAGWPGPLEDAKCAVRWVRAHASELGVDPARIAVAGGSAGGWLAALVALTPGRFEGSGGWEDVASEVQAAVLYNPLLDVRSVHAGLEQSVSRFLGTSAPEVAADASPLAQITAAAPPVATHVGDEDDVTPAWVCEQFHARLDELGIANELQIVAGKGHGIPLGDYEGCVRTTRAFLARHLPVGAR